MNVLPTTQNISQILHSSEDYDDTLSTLNLNNPNIESNNVMNTEINNEEESPLTFNINEIDQQEETIVTFDDQGEEIHNVSLVVTIVAAFPAGILFKYLNLILKV
jgi:hypothetical protein